MFAAGAIVLLLAIMIAIKLLQTGTAQPAADSAVPADVLRGVTAIPATTLDAVGRGTVQSLPVPLRQPLANGPSGHPLLTYLGAEYCPYCAGERWAVVAALSRFGSFSDLRLTTSSASDIYPSTPTFTFHGATYSSPYIDFSSVELQSNVRKGTGYAELETPTAAQTQILRQHDAPPYVPSASAGAIPFIDFGNQYAISGASYNVGILQGHSWQDIAGSLANPNSEIARGVLGTANVLTATICRTTADQPADVCGDSVIQQLESQLPSTAAQ